MPRLPALLIVCLLLPRGAFALGSIGGDWTTGEGYRGWDVKGDTDFDEKGTWGGSASYAYAHSNTSTESRSNQVTGSINHVIDEQWNSKFGATAWEDTINNVKYIGPNFGITITKYASEDAVGESYRIAFDNDLYLYKAYESSSPRTIKVARRSVVIPADQGDVSLEQWHPTLTFEKPVCKPWILPWVAVSHSFYSKNPDLIEERAGRPNFSSSVGSLNGMVGGLFNNTAQAGLDFKLPAHIRLSFTLGTEQQATDNTWSTTQGISATALFFDHWHANLAWNRSIQDGVVQDLYTAGSAWWF